MRKPEHSAEPSIEEILASIRNIISDDGPSSKSSAQAQTDRPVQRSTQDFENALFEGEPARSDPRSGKSVANQGQGGNASDGGDEILELTEDFMLAEPSEGQPADPPSGDSYAGQPPSDFYADQAAGDSNPVFSPEEEELDEVLSNLAAKVERLAVPEATGPVNTESHSDADQLAEGANDESHAEAPEAEDSNFGAPEMPEPEVQPVGQPQMTGMAEPQPTPAPPSPAPSSHVRSASKPVSKSKPVWSARRLEQPAASKAKSEAKQEAEVKAQPSPPSPPAAPAQQSSKSSPVSRRDLWAEGVQMPVPETGPEMPLPVAENEAEEPLQQETGGSEEPSAADAERRAVGSFLTRVFGSTPAAEVESEPETADEKKLRAKAEKLARDTISDFAEEKLNAPAVGNALKADKQFMDEVATSLESALAFSSEEADEGSSAEAGLADQASIDDLPQAGMQAGTAPESGLDVKMKEALAADAKDSEQTAAEPIRKEEAASSPGMEEAVAAGVTQDDGAEPAPAETAEAAVADQEMPELPPESAETQQAQSESSEPEHAAPALSLPSGLEGSIKELIKPLIIQWLNDNLPRIVEEAVREELTSRTEIAEAKKRSRA